MYLTQEAATFVVPIMGLVLLALVANAVRGAFRRDGKVKPEPSQITLTLSRSGGGRVVHASEPAGNHADSDADQEELPAHGRSSAARSA